MVIAARETGTKTAYRHPTNATICRESSPLERSSQLTEALASDSVNDSANNCRSQDPKKDVLPDDRNPRTLTVVVFRSHNSPKGFVYKTRSPYRLEARLPAAFIKLL